MDTIYTVECMHFMMLLMWDIMHIKYAFVNDRDVFWEILY